MLDRHVIYLSLSALLMALVTCLSGCTPGYEALSDADGSLRKLQAAEAADKLNGYTPIVAVVKKGRVSSYHASEADAKKALMSASVKNINDSQILDAKRTRIPLKRAIELVISERAKAMPKPEPLVSPDSVQQEEVKIAPPPQLEIKPELVTQGKAAFAVCAACHSIDGSRLVGPSMKGLWGKVENLADGTKVRVNKEYFVRSIKEPTAQIVEGYPPAMANLPVTDTQIEALMHYVASLQ